MNSIVPIVGAGIGEPMARIYAEISVNGLMEGVMNLKNLVISKAGSLMDRK